MSWFELVKLPDAKKLETLRHLDQFRDWHSLDDKRYCLACGAIITGREIGLIDGAPGTGPVRAICPTRNCHSIPLDWVIPSDEVLAKISERAARHRSVRAPKFYPARNARNAISSRLRRFPGYLKRHIVPH